MFTKAMSTKTWATEAMSTNTDRILPNYSFELESVEGRAELLGDAEDALQAVWQLLAHRLYIST